MPRHKKHAENGGEVIGKMTPEKLIKEWRELYSGSPHSWNEQNAIRFVASFENLGNQLANELENALKENKELIEKLEIIENERDAALKYTNMPDFVSIK